MHGTYQPVSARRFNSNEFTPSAAEDVGWAAEKVTQAVRRGKLTPAEGNEMMNHFESRSRFIEGAKFETQLADLADKINAIQKVGEEHD